MAVSNHPLGHLQADQVAKGFYSTQHCFNGVCDACVACECGLVHIPHGGLQGNWAKAFSKMPHSHSLRSSPGVVQEQSKTLYGTVSTRKDCTGGGRGPNGLMEATDGQVMVFYSRNRSHLLGWLPQWRRGCRRMSMPRWKHCASSTTLTFRPTRLELITSKQCWHPLEFVNL